MTKKHVTITLTLDQAYEVRTTLTERRDTLINQCNLKHVTIGEKEDLERRIGLLSDSLLEF